jgi:glycosyltransferase involved in cell wall biosynthesis
VRWPVRPHREHVTRTVILVLHHRYRTTGGEERVATELAWLAREHLGEEVELLERDSALLGRARAAAGMLRGGLRPEDVGKAVRRSRATIVHAHNLHPTFGWRALAAAREAGARVVLHLHNYRLVCAVGTCFTRGADCTRCRGRNTLPGVRLACRGDRAEAVVYGVALARWQHRIASQADAIAVPSAFAESRLRILGAPLLAPVVTLPPPIREFAPESRAAAGRHALVVSRLAPEKGVEDAIEACARAGVPLVVAGDGPEAEALRSRARGDVEFAGRVTDPRLAALRRDAAVAIVPSRAAETFGMAAAEAMAAGIPVVATRMGALPELVGSDGVVDVADPEAMARAVQARFGDAAAGEEGLRRVRERTAPEVVANALRRLYALALEA